MNERRKDPPKRLRKARKNSLGAGSIGKKDLPLRDYAALVGLFNAPLAAFLLSQRRLSMAERFEIRDLFLLGLAAQKISRVMTRDRVTQPLRAPFTKYEGSGGGGFIPGAGCGLDRRRTG